MVSFVFTKKMNASLEQNISFLTTMDGIRHEKRIKSYQNLADFNKVVFIINFFTFGVKTTVLIFHELVLHWNKSIDDWKSALSKLVIALMDFSSSLPLLFFPIIAFILLPTMKLSKRKISCMKSEGEG